MKFFLLLILTKFTLNQRLSQMNNLDISNLGEILQNDPEIQNSQNNFLNSNDVTNTEFENMLNNSTENPNRVEDMPLGANNGNLSNLRNSDQSQFEDMPLRNVENLSNLRNSVQGQVQNILSKMNLRGNSRFENVDNFDNDENLGDSGDNDIERFKRENRAARSNFGQMQENFGQMRENLMQRIPMENMQMDTIPENLMENMPLLQNMSLRNMTRGRGVSNRLASNMIHQDHMMSNGNLMNDVNPNFAYNHGMKRHRIHHGLGHKFNDSNTLRTVHGLPSVAQEKMSMTLVNDEDPFREFELAN